VNLLVGKNGIINSYPSLRENLDTEFLIVGRWNNRQSYSASMYGGGYKTILIDRRNWSWKHIGYDIHVAI
jgi:hypothetical protein